MTSPNTPPRSNRTLWIILAIVGAVLLLGCICLGSAAAFFFVRTGQRVQTAFTTLESNTTPPAGRPISLAPSTLSPGPYSNPSWPADLPVISGSAMNRSTIRKSNGVTTGEFTFTVTADPDQVINFYDNQLSADGWTINDGPASAVPARTYSKAGRTVSVRASPSGEKAVYRVSF